MNHSKRNLRFYRAHQISVLAKETGPFVPFYLRMAGPPIDWRKVPSTIRDNVVSRVWQPISTTEMAN